VVEAGRSLGSFTPTLPSPPARRGICEGVPKRMIEAPARVFASVDVSGDEEDRREGIASKGRLALSGNATHTGGEVCGITVPNWRVVQEVVAPV